MDRISNLPTEIICHIGSFLSANDAACTTVLSKRWRNLFTIIPNLLYDSSVNNNGESFKEFSDRVFALPATSRVRNFSIKWRFEDTETAQYEQINRCLRHVMKLGVSDLELRICASEEEGYYSLPFEVFTCETVTKLTLGSGFVIDFLPANAYLPSLKTLYLDSIRFYEFGRCAFNTLLSASPKLVELVIDGVEFEQWKWSFTISSPTLRRLTIQRKKWRSDDGNDEVVDCRGLAYEFDKLSFDTPVLTDLDYSDYVPKEYPLVNLKSLVKGKLGLCVEDGSLWEREHTEDFDPMNLINALKIVQVLDLNIFSVEMFNVFRKAIPVFENLFHISLSLSNFCWYSVPKLLKKFPNLKTLTIEDSLHYCFRRDNKSFVCECVSEYSFLLTCPVEVLKINTYKGNIKELDQMKHFLEKLSRLELVEVCAQVSGEERVRVMADLLMLPRASTNCKIQVKFS